MKNLTAKIHDLGQAHIELYGSMPKLGLKPRLAKHLARKLGATDTGLILPPSKDDCSGRYLVLECSELNGDPVKAEGVILRKAGESVVISSRDCPVLVVLDKKSGFIGAVHAGRDSLINNTYECISCGGVVEQLIAKLSVPNSEDIWAYITGGISAKRFVHDNPGVVKPFIDRFGYSVIADGYGLNLEAVIRLILGRYGVEDKQISTDGLCTYDTPWLGSRRAHKVGSNWTFVIKKY